MTAFPGCVETGFGGGGVRDGGIHQLLRDVAGLEKVLVTREIEIGFVGVGFIGGDLRLGLVDRGLGGFNGGLGHDEAGLALLFAGGGRFLGEGRVGFGLLGCGEGSIEVALGFFNLVLERRRVEFHQRVAGFDELIVIDEDGSDMTGDAGADIDDVAIDEGVVGRFILACVEIPEETGDSADDDDEEGNEEHPFTVALGNGVGFSGRLGCRAVLRNHAVGRSRAGGLYAGEAASVATELWRSLMAISASGRCITSGSKYNDP